MVGLRKKGGDHHHDVDDDVHDQHHVHDDSHDDVHDAQEHRLRLSLKYRHGPQQHRSAVLLMTVPILERQSMLLCIINIIVLFSHCFAAVFAPDNGRVSPGS